MLGRVEFKRADRTHRHADVESAGRTTHFANCPALIQLVWMERPKEGERTSARASLLLGFTEAFGSACSPVLPDEFFLRKIPLAMRLSVL